jgi:hypothetical protein
MNLQNDEIDAREIVAKFKSLVNYLFAKKLIILFAVFIGAIIGFYFAYTTPPKYKVESSFMLENGKSSSNISAYASIIGGLNLSGNNKANISNDKLLEIIKSKRIVMNTLLKKFTPLNSKQPISFVNHLINQIPEDELLPYIIPINSKAIQYTELSSKELKSLAWAYNRECENIGVIFTKKSGIFKISCTNTDQQYAYFLTKELLSSIEEFFSSKTGEKQKQTFTVLKNKRDSIKELLLVKESELALLLDRSQFAVKSQAYNQNKQTQRDINVLNIIYIECVKNVEQSRMDMLEHKSLLQIIDNPVLPGEEIVKSKIRYLIGGATLGWFFIIGIIILQLINIWFKK